MQKAKHRTSPMTKIVYVPTYPQNGNGSYKDDYQKDDNWMPGDPPEKQPLFSSMGAFKDDPFWDEFVQAMDNERRKIDEWYPVEDDTQANQEDGQSVRA